MYGLRRILFAAAMTRLTAAGALSGAMARPLTIRAFLTGLQSAGATESPPVVVAFLQAACAGEAKAKRAMKVSAARVAADAAALKALALLND
jgi:hypothetical protein